MADLSDVMNTLVGVVSGILYPNGTSQPSIAGIDVSVMQGWPIPATLQTTFAAGKAQLSIYPRQEERNTTRYLRQWTQASVNTPTLTLTASGQTVTVAGTIPTSQNPTNVVIFANGLPYVYAVQPSDTLSTIAAALAALIVVSVPGTTSSGAAVTLPNSARLGAVRVGVTGTSVLLTRQQERLFQLSIWTADPISRNTIASPVDAALADTPFLTFPDGSSGRLIYKRTMLVDEAQKQGIYRRDLYYTVDYSTLDTETDTQITQIGIQVSAAVAGVTPGTTVVNTYS